MSASRNDALFYTLHRFVHNPKESRPTQRERRQHMLYLIGYVIQMLRIIAEEFDETEEGALDI